MAMRIPSPVLPSIAPLPPRPVVVETPKPPLTRVQAYDLLADGTNIGKDAVVLDRGAQKLVGKMVTLGETYSHRKIRGSRFRVRDLVLRSKEHGVEVLGAGKTWEEALDRAGVRW
jgi:hypothetical protein